MRPGNTYRGAKDRDIKYDQHQIGAKGSISTQDGDIPIRRVQSICAAKKRVITKPPGKEFHELCVDGRAKALKAYTRTQMEAMRKTPVRRPMFAGLPNAS